MHSQGRRGRGRGRAVWQDGIQGIPIAKNVRILVVTGMLGGGATPKPYSCTNFLADESHWSDLPLASIDLLYTTQLYTIPLLLTLKYTSGWSWVYHLFIYIYIYIHVCVLTSPHRWCSIIFHDLCLWSWKSGRFQNLSKEHHGRLLNHSEPQVSKVWFFFPSQITCQVYPSFRLISTLSPK